MKTNQPMLAIWKSISMTDGSQIIIASAYADEKMLSLHDINHNIFRLDKHHNVVWQVRRDDSNHPPDWWANLHEHARERGEDGAREPFMYFLLRYPDGRTNCLPETGDPPDHAIWTPDCTIHLQGSAYQDYILDPETGIARNVTNWPVRPW